MNVFRLGIMKFSRDLSGQGAEKVGGRWNSRGTPLIYTSASRALCTAELAVHLPLGNVPAGYQLTIIEIPEDSVSELDMTTMPRGWNIYPHSKVTQEIGDRFVAEMKSLVLKVPSAVVSGDFNYLINPKHPDIAGARIIAVEDYSFDDRLFRR